MLTYLNSAWRRVNPSEICFKLGRTWISTQPSGDGAWRTIFIKKSAKTCWILNSSPETTNELISSGISRINYKFLSLSNNTTWLTTAFMTLPSKNSPFSSSNNLTPNKLKTWIVLLIAKFKREADEDTKASKHATCIYMNAIHKRIAPPS